MKIQSKKHTEEANEESHEEISISDVDRAATVTLQSWYEVARSLEENDTTLQNDKALSRKQTLHRKVAQGHVHLLPFLNAYTTNGVSKQELPKQSCKTIMATGRSMPLELAVVFIRFLRTNVAGHVHESVELSSEILHRVVGAFTSEFGNRSASTSPTMPSHVRSCCEDLFNLVFVETLPFSSSQNAVVIILDRFLSSHDETWSTAAKPLVMSDTPNADAILRILSFLNTLPPSWSQASFPSHDSIQNSRNSLRRLLKLLELENQERDMPPNSRRQQFAEESVLHEGKRRIRFADDHREASSTGNSQGGSLESCLLPAPSNRRRGGTDSGILSTVVHYAGNAKELIQKWKDNKGALAFVLVMILLAWRKRQRVASVSSAALRLFLAPIREVVDAILKPT